MATDVGICSQALLLLRANTISSMSGDSNEAEICNTLYKPFIKSLLTLHPWTFAMKKRQLNQDTTAPAFGYPYSHIVPAEALLVWGVYDTDSDGAAPIVDFEMFGVEGGRRIYSDYSTLYADYTVYTAESNWPPYFEQFVVNALAAHLAMPVTGSATLMEYYDKIAYGSGNANRKGGMYGVAAITDSKQKKNPQVAHNPFVSARFS